jgi:hypothetical protein
MLIGEEGKAWRSSTFEAEPPAEEDQDLLGKGKEWKSPTIETAPATETQDLRGEGKEWKRPTVETAPPTEDQDLLGKGKEWKRSTTETPSPAEDQDLLGKGKEWRNRTFETAPPAEDSKRSEKGKEQKKLNNSPANSKLDGTKKKPRSSKSLVAHKNDSMLHVFEDDSGFLSSIPAPSDKELKFKPLSTWASPVDGDEMSHPIKKPKDKKTRSAVTVKKTGRNKATRMKPQHADDASVVKIKKGNRMKSEVTYTKKRAKRKPRSSPGSISSKWQSPFDCQ